MDLQLERIVAHTRHHEERQRHQIDKRLGGEESGDGLAAQKFGNAKQDVVTEKRGEPDRHQSHRTSAAAGRD